MYTPNNIRMNVNFGIGGIRHGPEFDNSGRNDHTYMIHRLSRPFFQDWDHRNPIPSIGFPLYTAGKFEPSLVTHVGKIKYSKKSISIRVPMYMAMDSFQRLSESKFRELLVEMLDNAFEQTVTLIRKRDLPYSADSIEEAWNQIRAQYLALPLPIVYIRDSKPPAVPAEVEYYFVFDNQRDRTSFLKKIAPFALEVKTDTAEGRHWCTLTDPNAKKVNQELEKQLVREALQLSGDYDGWSAPEI